MKIVHITSVHQRYDTRIFLKECTSLAKNRYTVILLTADGNGNELKNSVSIIDIGKKKDGRFFRMTFTVIKLLNTALKLNADLYHIHDPEFLLAGLLLRLKGKKIIYDIHEDVPSQIINKTYLNRHLRFIISILVKMIEKYAARRFNGVIAATPIIEEIFKRYNSNTVNINNYPFTMELTSERKWKDRKNQICYVGDITRIRGVSELIDSLVYVDTKLYLAGNFSDLNLEAELQRKESWKKVVYLGFINREQYKDVLSYAKIGVVTFLPDRNHISAQPNKLFEYMSAGIPVIASNFPLWKKIVEDNECGKCVNPSDPEEIAGAIRYLLQNDQIAEKMGSNGIKMVKAKYNWEIESAKLLRFYKSMILG